ncbi:MAG: hypothetical protein A2253_03155 [Deltaproteobacteria bacterium RIFOXYA2_FULL_55_11]|nr:MAG: hypothetical protein A2253_03155 [Deltaproteobacteria bacterium RIFOXYA2_FULL_55_11]
MKQVELKDIRSLIDHLKNNGVGSRPLRVGIDGSYGIGKSTLAYCLACQLNVAVLSIDQFIFRDGRPYVEQIRPEIKDLCDHYVATRRTFFIEGVCLLAVLERIGLSVDILIYIRKLDSLGEWCDSELYNGIESETEWTKKISNLPEVLEKQVAEYHFKYRPFNGAHFVYSVTHGD